jgi:hypothetical protein
VGKPEGKGILGRSRRRWEDNIKMDLQEIELKAWTGLICLRTGTGCCEYGNEPPFSIKYGEFLDWLNYYCLLEKDFAQWS